MTETDKLLENQQGSAVDGVVLRRAALPRSTSGFCGCCRSGPLSYLDVSEAADDAAAGLIAELSVMPTEWSDEAKDARVVDALQRIWTAIASESPETLRLAPPRIPNRDWRKIGFQVRRRCQPVSV